MYRAKLIATSELIPVVSIWIAVFMDFQCELVSVAKLLFLDCFPLIYCLCTTPRHVWFLIIHFRCSNAFDCGGNYSTERIAAELLGIFNNKFYGTLTTNRATIARLFWQTNYSNFLQGYRIGARTQECHTREHFTILKTNTIFLLHTQDATKNFKIITHNIITSTLIDNTKLLTFSCLEAPKAITLHVAIPFTQQKQEVQKVSV